ncbi:similar to Saccharomyces cerevisiae YDR318W MCM21 Protein involved in minichromosome maintenance [Maudiozyma barnettii]|uniref:Similar to Saccharomyces cerevisiae YDR318W MCM21 Protein involved in minichromosome maintenance n=1 Tax=Maudiozyma barnettii TaxID=61262 RepID=A0A8H2VE07_9SACH|nr:Mcm21p [Kazachstania barnettii]CAB4253806.1 similar to Saccharomyces cerevisiae YDR318W MCM21 Protein involved in minichromosome maintenance [Kazachstania barnettii]CAD1781555.1 similar to Saccharomyces cerevisiae YDR318W MCM21 Protein involved in minichromosome maintenance [Kazachstania barnettii]
MTILEELEQDISALKEEINSLKKKATSIKGSIKDKKTRSRRKVSTTTSDPVASDFKKLFDQFPQLYRLLHDDQQDQSEDNIKNVENESMNANNVKVLQTPRKKSRIASGGDDLPESEWVLRNQIPLEHQMFDNSIIDDMDVDILSSPSKRKAELRKIESDKSQNGKLRNKVLIENMFRLFGITFFPLVDPTDLKLNDETQKIEITRQMLGIRLDIFNSKKASFDKTYYILLKRSNKTKDKQTKDTNTGKWIVFKHTIPIYIDIEMIMRDLCTSDSSSYEDVYIFAKEVYILLLNSLERGKIFETLEMKGLINNLKNDIDSTSVLFSLGAIKIQLYLDKDIITSCLITQGVQDEVLKTKWETILNGPLDELEFKIKQLL